MCFSILTAAVPPLHRVFQELHSGGFASDIPLTEHELTQMSAGSGNRSKNARSKAASKYSKQHSKQNGSAPQSSENRVDFRPDIMSRGGAVVTASNKPGEDNSRSSREGSEDMIIRRTQTWHLSKI
jgi:hypothetical protein